MLDKRLNLRRRAREDAARNYPGPQAQELSETECEIVALVAAERTKLDAERAAARTEIKQRLRALAPTHRIFPVPRLKRAFH